MQLEEQIGKSSHTPISEYDFILSLVLLISLYSMLHKQKLNQYSFISVHPQNVAGYRKVENYPQIFTN